MKPPNAALAVLNDALSACGNVPDNAKSSIESSKREVESYRKSTERLLKGLQLSGYEQMAKAAFNAGDAGTYERARNERIKLLTSPEDKRDLSILYGVMAEELVTLTADRAKGADLWAKARQAGLEAQPEHTESLTRWYEQNKAVWWPEGK